MFYSLYSFVALWLVSHPVVFFLIELNRLIEVLIKMRGQETKLKDKGENEAHLIQSSEQRNLCLMQLLEERKGSWGSSRRNLGWGSKVEAASCQKKKLRPLSKEIYLEHGFPVGADKAEEPQVSNQRLITRPRGKSPLVLGLQLYRCSVF